MIIFKVKMLIQQIRFFLVLTSPGMITGSNAVSGAGAKKKTADCLRGTKPPAPPPAGAGASTTL